jgi:hypothetical protein
MNEQTYQDTQLESSDRLAEILPDDFNRKLRRELAEETVRAEMAQMEAAGRVLQLTDEEIRLLYSFRRFKSNVKKIGEVFRWQTTPTDASDSPLELNTQGDNHGL